MKTRCALATALCLFANVALAAEQPRTISVNGEATVQAEADRARFNLGVEARSKTLADARERVNQAAARVLKLTDELEIERRHVDTTGGSIRPEYQYNKLRSGREFIGYFVQRSIVIELRDLSLIGTVMERAVDAGINQVNPPQLLSSRDNEFRRKALELAAADARANANALATGAGVQLGSLHSLSMSGGFRPQPMMMARSMAVAEDAGGAATYQAGELTFSANVQAVYEIQD